MIFNTGAALLDAIVLSVVSKETNGTYGYKITQDVRNALDVSESTLYPVLRRLLKDNCLELMKILNKILNMVIKECLIHHLNKIKKLLKLKMMM